MNSEKIIRILEKTKVRLYSEWLVWMVEQETNAEYLKFGGGWGN